MDDIPNRYFTRKAAQNLSEEDRLKFDANIKSILNKAITAPKKLKNIDKTHLEKPNILLEELKSNNKKLDIIIPNQVEGSSSTLTSSEFHSPKSQISDKEITKESPHEINDNKNLKIEPSLTLDFAGSQIFVQEQINKHFAIENNSTNNGEKVIGSNASNGAIKKQIKESNSCFDNFNKTNQYITTDSFSSDSSHIYENIEISEQHKNIIQGLKNIKFQQKKNSQQKNSERTLAFVNNKNFEDPKKIWKVVILL